MEYDSLMADVVHVVEAVGVVLMVLGGLVSVGGYAVGVARRRDPVGAYDDLRRRLARVILLGLEVLLLADIIRTIVVDQTVESVLVLGVVVVIRIVLSFSLQVEIEGTWPWRLRGSTAPAPAAGVTDGPAAPPRSGSR